MDRLSDSARSEPPMDPAAWDRLACRALWQLEHPDQMSPPEGAAGLALHLRLWRYRRRGTQVSWSLFLPVRNDGPAVVRELRWNAAADLRRLASSLMTLKRRPSELPSMRLRDALIDEAKLVPFLLEAPEILAERMPPREDAPDVVRDVCGIEGYRSLTHLRLEWDLQGPEPSVGLVGWVVRLRTLLESSLRDRETA